MAHTAYPTFLSGDSWTASQANTYWRDNDLQYFPYTTAGDLQYAATSSTTARLAIGTNYRILRVSAGLPSWADVLQFCIVNRSTNQSFSSGSSTTILWDAETSDGNGWHSTSSNTDRITPTDAGWYMPFVQIYWNKDTGGAGTMHLTAYVAKNGIATANRITVYEEIDANTKQFTFGGNPVQTIAGDYFTVYFVQNSGGAGSIIGSGDFYSVFSLFRVA